MKKILIINGHPAPDSFNNALAEAYQKGAISAGAKVELLHLRELKFNLSLEMGYRVKPEMEPDLLMAQEKIKWADHLVWVHPVWWGSLPALLKGFIDRTLVPGFAFQKRKDSLWWDKLLAGRSARIISTMDQPPWYYRLFYSQPSNKAMKKVTLHYCGIKPVRITNIGPIRLSKDAFRKGWLDKVEALGRRMK